MRWHGTTTWLSRNGGRDFAWSTSGCLTSIPLSPLPVPHRTDPELPIFDYDPAWWVSARITATELVEQTLLLRDHGDPRLTQPGEAQFEVLASSCDFRFGGWAVYGGGLLLSSRDANSGQQTYGCGRYLLDTIQGGGPGRCCGPVHARLQLRLQPLLCSRPSLTLPAAGPRQLDRGQGEGRGVMM